MLRFFRQFRKKLMEQNKVRTYIFYAIGEILLVVIGILIALQVNNWNQNRLDRIYEKTMLSEISLALDQDISNLERSLDYLNSVQHSVSELAKIKNNPNHPRDSLMHHFNVAGEGGIAVIFNSSSYEALKSSGLDKVLDPELRKNISLLYELQLGTVEGWINEVIRAHLLDKNDFMRDEFEVNVEADSSQGIRVEYKELSYDLIHTDPKFETFLSLTGNYIPRAKTYIGNAIEAMAEVKDQIDTKFE